MKKKLFYYLIVINLVLITSQNTFSESFSLEEKLNQPWRWTEFDENSGLPSNEIYDIYQSEKNTFWVLTSKGFAWYDGYQWIQTYNQDQNKNFSQYYLNENLIITKGPGDELVTSFDGNFSRITKKGIIGKILTYKGKNLYIHSIVQFHANKYLLLAAINDGQLLKCFVYQNNKLDTFPMPYNTLKHHSAKSQNVLINGNNGSVWMNSSYGLFKLNRNNWSKLIDNNDLSKFDFTCPITTKNNKTFFYIGFPAEYTGLWEMQNDQKPKLRDSLKIMLITSGIRDDGTCMFIYNGGKTEIFRNGKFVQLENIPEHLRAAIKIQFSKNGNLLIATPKNLYYCYLGNEVWDYWINNVTEKRSFVNEIIKARDSSLWISYGDGVEQRNGKEILHFHDRIKDVSLEGVTALNEDNQGNIWIGSGGYFSGAYKWNGLNWIHHPLLIDSPKINIHKIRKDRLGRLWFLTLSGKSKQDGFGAVMFDGKHTEVWDVSKGLLSNRVYEFIEDNEGAYWFATYLGICRYKKGKWKYWNSGNGLRSNVITTMCLAPDGKTIYFANYGTGVAYIRNDQVQDIKVLDNLNLVNIMNLIFINNKLLIGTKNGLYFLTNDIVLKFDRINGLSSNMIWPLFYYNDKLYIGTTGGGVNILNLNTKMIPAPKIQIYDYKDLAGNFSIGWKIFPYKGRFISEDYHVQYRIDNKNWSPWINNNNTKLNIEITGNHVFELRVMSPLGDIFKKTSTFEFDINTPIYKKIEFIVPILFLITLLITSMIYFGFKRRNYIVKLRKSRLELNESEKKYRHIVENASDGILLNVNGHIEYANQKIADLLEYTVDELKGSDLQKYLHPDEISKLLDFQKNIHQTNEIPERFEVKLLKKNNNILWAEVRVRKLSVNEGYSTLAMITDIGQRKEFEEKLQMALKKEKDLGDLKTRIISTISHEYRTPLTIVRTSSDLLKIYYNINNENKFFENIGKINKAVDRMTKFLEDIILLAKIESSNFEYNFEKIDVVKFANDIINSVRSIDNNEHELIFEYNNFNGNIDIEPFLYMVLIQRILLNATINSPEGSSIYISLTSDADNLVFTVRDIGYGLNYEKINDLFDPFFYDNDRESRKVSSFAMAIVKACVDSLKGKIEIKSTPNQETIVIVAIPVKETLNNYN